jgi:hypothetical protein
LKQEQLDKILSKPGYGVVGGISRIKSSFSGPSIHSALDGKRPVQDLESDSGRQSLEAPRIAIRNSGMCTVRITAFRRRLADPDGNSFKASLDFITRSGALVDDSARYIRLVIEPQVKVETNEEERVEFVLEYECVDEDNLFVEIPI